MVNAGAPLNNYNTYYWHVRHRDSNESWSDYSTETSFTTGYHETFTLHPSGAVTYQGCSTIGGSWATVLDTNDGNTSVVSCTVWTMIAYYYYYYGYESPSSTFTVAMDPAGLGGANINSVTAYALVDIYDIHEWSGVPYPLFQICFSGNPYCSIANFNNGYVEVTVDHPDPSSLNLNNIIVDVITQIDGMNNGQVNFFVTELGVVIDYY